MDSGSQTYLPPIILLVLGFRPLYFGNFGKTYDLNKNNAKGKFPGGHPPRISDWGRGRVPPPPAFDTHGRYMDKQLTTHTPLDHQ